MGAKSRRKGKSAEREIVSLAREHGLTAVRTWQTAQSPDPVTRKCDVRVAGRSFQVKVSANGFKKLYDELEDVCGFFLRRDRGEWLVVLRAEDYLQLVREAAQKR